MRLHEIPIPRVGSSPDLPLIHKSIFAVHSMSRDKLCWLHRITVLTGGMWHLDRLREKVHQKILKNWQRKLDWSRTRTRDLWITVPVLSETSKG